MVGRRRIPIGFLALAVFILTSGCVDFPPNPTVCLSCELGVEQATNDRLNVSVDESELRIQVDEHGDGRWTVRSELSGPDVAALRADPSLVDRLVNRSVTGSLRREGIHHPAIHGGDVRDVSGRLVGDVLVISFTVPDVAEPGAGGILLVDFFHTQGHPPESYMLGTDRLVVTGPPETVITNDPPDATVTDGGQTVVWQSFEGRVSSDTYLAFALDDGRQQYVATEATVARHVAGWVTPQVLSNGLPLSVILLGAITLLTRRVADRWPIRVGSPDDSVRSRLASDPPVDIAVVLFLVVVGSAGIVTDFGGFRGVFETLFPLLGPGLFGLLGYSIEASSRATRSLTTAIFGLPIMLASGFAVVGRGYASTGSVYGGSGILVALLVVFLVGLPAFYLGYRNRPERVSGV